MTSITPTNIGTVILVTILAVVCPAWGLTAEAQPEKVRVSLEKAKGQLEIALKHAELSLAPHQPGSGWTRQHMQRVLNILAGAQGQDFSDKVDNPGDGYGAAWHIRDALDKLPGGLSTDAGMALDHTLAYINDAAKHARHSVKGTSVTEVHREAALAAGMLAAALGRSDSKSPAIGALVFAMRSLEPLLKP
jgi:hypothetical protein